MDGTNFRTVINDGQMNIWTDYNPVNGQTFLMQSNRTNSNIHLYYITSDGAYITQLSEGNFNDENGLFSPDAKFIMYRRLDSNFDKTGKIVFPYELVIKEISSILINHGPIKINGNADFDSQAIINGWQGDGSAEKPNYIHN